MTTDYNNGQLAPNTLAFIALCNEYCAALENMPASATPAEFVTTMLRLLPRIYISATDLRVDDTDEAYLEPAMDEASYNTIQSSISALLGEHDTYLEVFEEDMKFSDTPIATGISEGLADIMQVLFNFIEMAKDAPDHIINAAVTAVKDDFRNYWSRILCNVLRALNALEYSQVLESESDY